jgi:hypothetical protein
MIKSGLVDVKAEMNKNKVNWILGFKILNCLVKKNMNWKE